MRLCTACLHVDDRKVEHCPSCGGEDFAKLNGKGDVVAIPAGAMPCQDCLQNDRDLKLRYYRRVTAMLFVDHIHGAAGYFCASCRRRQFGRHFGLTLLLGWWGIFAFWLRNPYAILVNLWALFAPPFGAANFGAINVNEIRADAGEDQRLEDLYMQMPSWFARLDESELDLILTERDYYGLLRVSRTASSEEVKTAWRGQVKRHHPDTATAPGAHERMVEINDAYKVLGDERLRHAYDHRDELVAFLEQVRGSDVDLHDEGAGDDYAWGCRICRTSFADYDELLDHARSEHPGEDLLGIVVELEDGNESPLRTIYVCKDCGHTEFLPHDIAEHIVGAHGLDEWSDHVDYELFTLDDADGDEGDNAGTRGDHRWRCKACGETFDDYDGAIAHADRMHPDRVAIDVRNAVEPA